MYKIDCKPAKHFTSEKTVFSYDFYSIDADNVYKQLKEGKSLLIENGNERIFLDQKTGVLSIDGFESFGGVFYTLGFGYNYHDVGSCFKIRSHVKKIVVGEGTKYLEYNSLSGYPNVEEIVLPESLESIYACFTYLPLLTKINFPQNLSTIKGSVFLGSLEKMGSITIPDHITDIGTAFSRSKIKEIILPKNLEIIAEDAFYYAQNLQNVVFNDCLKEIGQRAFYGTQLEKICLPQSLKEIGYKAFGNSKIAQVENKSDVKLCKNMFLESPFAVNFFDEIGLETFDQSKHKQPVLTNETTSALCGKNIAEQAKLLHFVKEETNTKYSYGNVDSKNVYSTSLPLCQVSATEKIIVKDGIIVGAVIDGKTFAVGQWQNVYYASDDDGTGSTSTQTDATLQLK